MRYCGAKREVSYTARLSDALPTKLDPNELCVQYGEDSHPSIEANECGVWRICVAKCMEGIAARIQSVRTPFQKF